MTGQSDPVLGVGQVCSENCKELIMVTCYYLDGQHISGCCRKAANTRSTMYAPRAVTTSSENIYRRRFFSMLPDKCYDVIDWVTWLYLQVS